MEHFAILGLDSTIVPVHSSQFQSFWIVSFLCKQKGGEERGGEGREGTEGKVAEGRRDEERGRGE